MEKFKVKALSVGGSSNRIYHSGDIVTAGNFPDGNAEKLVKEGFLEPYDEEAAQAEEDQKAKELEEANKAKQVEEDAKAEQAEAYRKQKEADDAAKAEEDQKKKVLEEAEKAKQAEDALKSNELKTENPADENQNPGPTLFDDANEKKEEEKAPIPDFDLVTRPQLIALATEKGLEFAANISKKDLFDLVYKG